MGKKNKWQPPPQRPEPTPVARAVDVGSAVALAAAAHAPAAEPPLYRCTVAVFSDRVELTPEAEKGEIKGAPLGGKNGVTFHPERRDAPRLMALAYGVAKIKSGVRSWSRKWFDRSCAAVLWGVFVSFLFFQTGIVGRGLRLLGVDATWEPYVLLLLVAAVLLVLARRGVAGGLLASVYIALFPAVAISVILAKLFGGVRLFKRVSGALGSFTYRGANWIIMVVCCAAIVKATDATVIFVAITYLAVGTVYLVLSNFVWVTRPLSTLFSILEWLDDRSNVQLEKFSVEFGTSITSYKNVRENKARSSMQQKMVGQIDTAKVWHWVASLVRGKLRRVVAPVVLFYLFAARFLASVALLVLVFASIYLGLSKTGHGSFGGAGIHDLSRAIYFSVATFCTVGYGDVTPLPGLAQWIVVVQMGTGLIMLTLLALSFSTLSNQNTSEAADQMETSAKSFIEKLTGVFRQHFRLDGKPLEQLLDDLKNNPDSRLLQ